MKTKSSLAIIFVSLLPAALFAQGPLAPTSGPTPTMRTLLQIEPRTPIAGGTSTVTISTPGSYYLTGNITVSTGNGILVNASNVTIDLNGFTIASTDTGNSGGGGVTWSTGLTAISVRNGFIKGSATESNGTYSGAGFYYGVGGNYYAFDSRVSNVSVSNLPGYGIALGNFSAGNIVENCSVDTVGQNGITSTTVRGCVVLDCGNYGIFASEVIDSYATTASSSDNDAIYSTVVSNSYAYAGGGGSIDAYGIECYLVENSYGYSPSSSGISCTVAHNCRGASSNYMGIGATVVTGSYGTSNNITGISATDVLNSYGSGGETGISANTASGCTGFGGSTDGIYVEDTAVGCYGSSNSSYGIFSNNTATSCVGTSAGLVGLQAKNSAEACTGTSTSTTGPATNNTGLYTQTALNCVGYSQIGTGLIATATATGCYGQTASTAAGVYGISGFILNVCHGVIGNGSANSVNANHNINSF